MADKLIREYDCATGFGEAMPEKVTVTVILKEEKKVVGLPKRIISLSNDLASNYGGKRKWTFGFDNRKFTTDLTWEGIDALLRDDKIYDVVVEPIAKILTVLPPYDPGMLSISIGEFPEHSRQTPGVEVFMATALRYCVIDTGIKYTHQAFWKDGVTNFKGGNDFVNGDNDPMDDHDHGTWCCGIIGHQHNGINGSYRGIAPNAELYCVKVLDGSGSGSLSNVAAGIDWARTNEIRVVSMSLGSSEGSDVMYEAVYAADQAGVLIVAAAGNSGPYEDTVGYPGYYDECVAVAAINYNDQVASFSSRGDQVDIAAPGVDVVGPWAGITYADNVIPGSNDLYFAASGTSGSTPHVAGCVALVRQWQPTATNAVIKNFLYNNSRKL